MVLFVHAARLAEGLHVHCAASCNAACHRSGATRVGGFATNKSFTVGGEQGLVRVACEAQSAAGIVSGTATDCQQIQDRTEWKPPGAMDGTLKKRAGARRVMRVGELGADRRHPPERGPKGVVEQMLGE